MENLLKSLSESVSEQCYNEIMGLIEATIHEYTEEDRKNAALRILPKRQKEFDTAFQKHEEVVNKISSKKGLEGKLTPVERYKVNKAAAKVERTQDRLTHAQEVAGKIENTPHGIKVKN